MRAFTPLRVHSHGSLLYGTASPETLIAAALARGCEGLALADRDNLYLAIRFWKAARAEGLAPILGALVTARRSSALLLALDRRGYANLCAVLTARHLDSAFDLAPALAERHAGLHVVVESPTLAAALLAAGVPAAEGEGVAPRRGDGRPGGLWLGVRGLAAERGALAERVAFSHRLGVPLLATGEVVMRDPRDHDAHRVAVTAAAGELLERMPPSAFAAREAWLAPAAEWDRRVLAACAAAGVPESARDALANNRLAASRCRLELELGTPIFPHAPLPAGETGIGRLRQLGAEGIRRRYGRDDPRAQARLATELEMIERLGFTDYFLLVADIVGFARAQQIPTVGRGSGASSLVAYVLGITNVDPIAHGLHFERFLNPARRDCPDLDIDLCWKRRDEVIAHVYRTYGDDRVAMISTHATLGARSAFRETAKALGIPNARVNVLARSVPHELPTPYLPRLGQLPEGRRVDWREPVLTEALRLAEALDGAPRHLSVHCGGIVIADRLLTHYVPLEEAAKGVVVTQFEMRAIEALGLVKMDLLGNRALSTIGECVTLARARGAEVDPERIPATDPLTAERLASGDTMNGFQLESPAMRHLLRMMRCSTLEETIAAVALIRPGAAESGMKEVYCRRIHGLERATYLHPRLEPVLSPTFGVMLYEEDVMRVAAALAGLSLAEGDDLRRAIGAAREDQEFRSLEHGFVAHAVRAGVEPEIGRAVWRDLTRFGGYAFCKAHAAGYGTLGWQSVWLKARFPAEWAVGILNHHAGMYSTWVHVEDLRRHGVTFLAPCVNASSWDTTLEISRSVRVGLSRVFGLAEATGARIVGARGARPFASLADFTDRARATLPEVESLILAGALDRMGRTRASLLLEARVSAAGPVRAAAVKAPALVGSNGAPFAPDAVAPVAVPELPEFDRAERVRGESRSTGLWFSGHPLDLWTPAESWRGVSDAVALPQLAGRRVAVAGMPCAMRRVETRSGGQMLFLTLADRTGLAECALFPDAYRALAGQIRGQIVRVEGRVDETLGAVTVTVESARVLTE